jgi:hypothetical protein
MICYIDNQSATAFNIESGIRGGGRRVEENEGAGGGVRAGGGNGDQSVALHIPGEDSEL